MLRDRDRTVVIGAGPAGLSAAWELARNGRPVVVLEADPSSVGGISRTVRHGGFRFDIGGHRFFSKNAEIESLWTEILGERMEERARLSRIYYRGRFFRYPLEPLETLWKLGPIEAALCLLSYLRAQITPPPAIRSFEDWVVSAFGRRLYETFFRSYTEKVWGIPCHEISADWAAQRIKGLSIPSLVRGAILGRTSDGAVIKTLIDRFRYPPHGPGEVWEEVARRIHDCGGEVQLGRRVIGLRRCDDGVAAVVARNGHGDEIWEGRHFVSTMAIPDLVRALEPAAPEAIRETADGLHFRDFLTVALIVDRADVFPDNWIYVHEPDVLVGRIQNFKNWSPAMVPDPRFTVLGLEYFCSEGEELWQRSDAELVELGARELEHLKILDRAAVLEGVVVRQRKAYPVYDSGYESRVATVREFLAAEMPNLHLAGRNGMHKYNNQDHAMATGMLVARNIMGGSADPWSVNSDAEYIEEDSGTGGALRATPRRLQEPESVWGVPALDVVTPARGYVGIGRAALAVDVLCFFLLNHFAHLSFVAAFVVSALVGAVTHAWLRTGGPPFRGREQLVSLARDTANCLLINLGPLVVWMQYLEGRATLARILTAATIGALLFARQNLVAARRRWKLRRYASSGP